MLSSEMPADHVYIPVDSLKMQRALIKLVNNAIEASEEKQRVMITVSLKERSVMIVISDTGSGMDKETLENIFVPFYTKKSGGTGLGMAIAKKVIEGHHGNISVYSKVDEGTQITIELPGKGV
jgi:signal transduction histidine kinase